MTIDLVIFDCDGVLIDSEVISAKVLIRALATVGVHVDFAHVQKHFLGRSWTKVAQEIRSSHGFMPGVDFENFYRSQLLDEFEKSLTPTRGIEDILAALKVPCCVATSSTPTRAGRSLALTKLAPHFGESVFTASQVQNGKPAPDLFLFAAEACASAPERCLVIEDSEPGIQAAKAAGMQHIRYTGGAHLDNLASNILTMNNTVACFDNWENFRERFPQLF